MILNKISFKNVKRNESIENKKKIKIIKNKYKNPSPKKSNSNYNIIKIDLFPTNNIIIIDSKKHINKPKNNNSFTNIKTLNNNVNNIISNIKNQNLKTEQSTDFTSNINNNKNNATSYSTFSPNKNKPNNTSYSFSKKINRSKYSRFYSPRKKGTSPKINEKIYKNTTFSNLLKNQEAQLLKKGKTRNAKSSLQMPYIIKKNNTCKKYKYSGFYNSSINKDNNLKKEINDLMLINQNINLHLKKSKSYNLKNNNIKLPEYIKTSNNIYKDKTINIKFIFAFQRKKDEFIKKNRLLMKQNYFKNILNQRITKISNFNKNKEKKIKYLDSRINIYQTFISHFKIYNIINHNLRLLNIILEKNEYNNEKLLHIKKNYNNEIDRLKTSIKFHNNKRNAIIYWYELLCKIKGDSITDINNYNFNYIINNLIIDDLNKGFNRIGEKIIFLKNKYKNLSGEIFLLKNRKDKNQEEYKSFYDKDQEIIINKENELNILKIANDKLYNIRNNIINKKVIDYLDIEKYNLDLDKYNLCSNKNIIFIQKIGQIFENYIFYLKNNDNFNFEEKNKIEKIEKEIIIKNKKYNNLKNDKIKEYIFDILFIIERYINILLFNIEKEKQRIGNEEFNIVLKNFKMMENIEKKKIFLYERQNKIEEDKKNLIKEKIHFLPIKKVYIPFFAIKKQNLENNNLKIINKKNYSYDEKNLSLIDKNKQNVFYMDDDGTDKYNELLIE